MEFDETLTVLQGMLCSLENQRVLNREDSVGDAVEELRKIVENLPEELKSKAVFFMVLNTDLSVSEELKDDEFVGLFTNITPLIQPQYLVTYLYHLHLQQHLFRVIENCRGTLGIELLGPILEKLEDPRFHRDEFGLEHFYDLWQCVFVKICKISTGLHAGDNLQKFLSYFNCICDLVQRITVTCMKMKNVENIAGLHLYYFFKSFLFFLKLSKNPNLSDDPLYQLSAELRPEETKHTESPVAACIHFIFSKVVQILDNLTIDLWMNFSEFNFEFDSKNSVQMLIGGLVFSILEEAEGHSVSSDVWSCLSGLAINKFTSAALDEMIANVRNGEREWFTALVRHPAVTESESVRCLIDSLHLASSDDLSMILTLSYKCIGEAGGSGDLLKDLFLAAVVKSPDYPKWLKRVLDERVDLTTAHTQNDLTETFNKISKETNLLEELKSLCIQCPSETIKKVCHLAISGSLPIQDVISLFRVVQQPCRSLQGDSPACLDCIVLKGLVWKDFSDKEKQTLIDLVVQLGKEELLGPLFSRNLLGALKGHLEEVELEEAVVCLRIVKSLLELKLFVIDEVVFLVFLSQVLGHLTWDLSSFSTVKADGRDLVICMVSLIVSELEEKENDSRCSWARREIGKCCEVNQACFCDLWFRFGRTWPCSGSLPSCLLALAHSRRTAHHLTAFSANLGQPFDVRASIVLSLITLLPILTFRELSSTFDSLISISEGRGLQDHEVYEHVMDMLCSSLYLLTLSLAGRPSYPCYEHCLRNFGRLGRQSWPKMGGGALAHTFERILFVLAAIEDEDEKKSCCMICLPVLQELIDWMKKKKALEGDRKRLREALALLEPTDVAGTLAQRLG